jgi:flagellin
MTPFSVNSNSAALAVLRNLNANDQLGERLHEQVSTGLKVATPADDGATWAIAQNMRSDIAAWGAVSSSLSRGQSILGVALAATTEVSDLLAKLKAYAVAYSDPSDANDAATLVDSMKSLVSQIDLAVNSASFDGNNLLTGVGSSITGTIPLPETTPGDPTSFSANVGLISGTIEIAVLDSAQIGFNIAFDGSTINFPPPTTPHLVFDAHRTGADGPIASVTIDPTVTPSVPTFTPDGPAIRPISVLSDPSGGKFALEQVDLTSTGLALSAVDWSSPSQVLATVDAAMTTTNYTAAQLGSQANTLGELQTQSANQQQALETGVGNLVDANLAKASAQLQAQQTKQQLGLQALSIANAQPQVLLSLFR